MSWTTGAPLEDIAEEEEQGEEEEDADIGEEDEMADFIVDEEEVDEHGAPMRYFKCLFYLLVLLLQFSLPRNSYCSV